MQSFKFHLRSRIGHREELRGYTAYIEPCGDVILSRCLRHNNEIAGRPDHENAEFAAEGVVCPVDYVTVQFHGTARR